VVDLASFSRPRTASIFARDPATLGKIVTFILTDLPIPVPNRVRLDLTRSIAASKRVVAARSPVEATVVDNIRSLPEVVTISGQLSATPLGPVASRLGFGGPFVRRDLRELSKLRLIQDIGDPVVLVIGARVYPSMAMSIDEVHDGSDKVELTLTFEEVVIVSPIAVAGVPDLEAVLSGASSTTNAGAQGTSTVAAPAGVAGGVG
jgi:hypothetical protein